MNSKQAAAHHGPPFSMSSSAQMIAAALTAGIADHLVDNVALEATTTSAKKV